MHLFNDKMSRLGLIKTVYLFHIKFSSILFFTFQFVLIGAALVLIKTSWVQTLLAGSEYEGPPAALCLSVRGHKGDLFLEVSQRPCLSLKP